MFRYEFRFDTEKAKKYGYKEADLYNAVRKIMNKQGVFEISNGIFEYENKTNPEKEAQKDCACTLRLLESPECIHFCNYWGTYDDDSGENEEHYLFSKRQNEVKLPCQES